MNFRAKETPGSGSDEDIDEQVRKTEKEIGSLEDKKKFLTLKKDYHAGIQTRIDKSWFLNQQTKENMSD